MAVAEHNGYETENLARLMTGFCGGASRTNGPCGALQGGIAAIGLLFGRDTPEDDKTLCYTLTFAYTRNFEKKFGSRNCSGVLPCDISTREGAEQFQKEMLGETVCPAITAEAAGRLQQIINRKEKYSHYLL